MPCKPQQNGVDEHRNRTLMDVVHSMLSYSTLPVELWMEALKIAAHILNRVLPNQFQRHLMNYGLGRNHRLLIYVCGAVLLKLSNLTPNKRN
jgi:hypothetical protein